MGGTLGTRKSPFKKYRCIQRRVCKKLIANLEIGFIEWVVLLFVATVNMVSPNTLWRSFRFRGWKKKKLSDLEIKTKENRATECYVFRSLSILILLNIFQPWISSLHFTVNWILGVLVSLRILEIDAILLSVFFLVRYGLQRFPVSINRSLILLFMNFFEIVLCFSLLYLTSQSVLATDCGNKVDNPLDSIYFSVVTITTLGYGDFRPIGVLGRLIVIFEALTGLLFVVVIFSSFLQMSRPHERKE